MIDARAAVLLRPGSAPELADVQIREPQGNEVLVGHEGAGTVLVAGPHARVDVGRQVAVLNTLAAGPTDALVVWDRFADAWSDAAAGRAVKPVLAIWVDSLVRDVPPATSPNPNGAV